MLLRWRCCGAVAPTNTFKKALWIWRWKDGCTFCPWVSWELCHFHVINQNAEILSTPTYTGFCEINIKWQHDKYKDSCFPGQHTPGMLASMYCHVPWSWYNTVKRSDKFKWHFHIFVQLHFSCAPGNRGTSSLYPTYIYIYIHIYIYVHVWSNNMYMQMYKAN